MSDEQQHDQHVRVWRYWRQQPTVVELPQQKPGESDRVYNKRVLAFIHGDDIRTKVDLRDWTGSLPFHLDNDKGAK